MPGYARQPQYFAQAVTVVPTGTIVSTNVQSAIAELDSDITRVDNEYVYSSASPIGAAVGTLWIDSDDFKTYVNSASGWQPAGGAGATGGGTDQVFYENNQSITTNYTISTNKNSMSAGPVTINNGVTVTIPNNSVWVII